MPSRRWWPARAPTWSSSRSACRRAWRRSRTSSARRSTRSSTQRKRLDSAYQRRALIRYDAIKDVGGRQSTTIAILDAHGSGIVVSAIQGRDYARLYVKDVVDGEAGSVELTPEERQAVDRAMA